MVMRLQNSRLCRQMLHGQCQCHRRRHRSSLLRLPCPSSCIHTDHLALVWAACRRLQLRRDSKEDESFHSCRTDFVVRPAHPRQRRNGGDTELWFCSPYASWKCIRYGKMCERCSLPRRMIHRGLQGFYPKFDRSAKVISRDIGPSTDYLQFDWKCIQRGQRDRRILRKTRGRSQSFASADRACSWCCAD